MYIIGVIVCVLLRWLMCMFDRLRWWIRFFLCSRVSVLKCLVIELWFCFLMICRFIMLRCLCLR